MKTFKEFLTENAKRDGYTRMNHWSSGGTTHEAWDKEDTSSPQDAVDRHMSTIQLWKERGKDPVYHAVHRVDHGYYSRKWENPNTQYSTIKHKSEHKTFEDARDTIAKHLEKK